MVPGSLRQTVLRAQESDEGGTLKGKWDVPDREGGWWWDRGRRQNEEMRTEENFSNVLTLNLHIQLPLSCYRGGGGSPF